jgi:hypothetical protein
LFQGNKEKNLIGIAVKRRQEGECVMSIKFCTKCGKKFESIGREVICPSCKQAAAEESKRAAVERAKRASWTGESVPVRISGRASTVIRRYGAANNLPFAAALDALLQASSFFQSTGKAWEDVEPYKSRRRKSDGEQEVKPQDGTQTTSTPQDVPQAAKATNKTGTAKKAVKTTSKAAGKATSTNKK